MFRLRRHGSSFISVVALVTMASVAEAQNPPVARSNVRRESNRLGVDLFGAAGASWPSAKESFKAVGLRSRPIDFGGGVRVTGLRGGMFVQVSGARWRDTGERVFVDSDDTIFPLGIPLKVNATFIDATLGLKRPLTGTRTPYFFYLGAEPGIVGYSERSPFAEAGEDIRVTKPSYHALAGVEIPVFQRLAAVVEAKYRYIPDLLGDGGASAIFGEDSFGGFNAAVGLRIGFGGRSSVARPPSAAAPLEPESTPLRAPVKPPPNVQLPTAELSQGVILEAAPVYILPDATRTPLRTLAKGTRVRILQQQGDWDEIEFPDTQWGPRIGWIQRRFVR